MHVPRDAAGSPRRSSPRTIHGAGPTASIGRAGKLTVDYVNDGTRTVFARTNARTPWHLLPPIYLDESGAAYTLLLNPSGGLVGGDHLSIDMRLGSEAHVLISTPSANRVYRSSKDDSVQDIEIRLGPGAVLEWVPEATIPFAGSRFHQSIHVTLGQGATLLLWDAIAAGRIACGERWAFTSLTNDIRITTASGSSLIERYDLSSATEPGCVGLASEWDYVASLFMVGEEVGDDLWSRLENELAEILDRHPGLVLGGVSRPEISGLAVKLVARSAPDLAATCDALWTAIRRTLWGLPPVALRKY